MHHLDLSYTYRQPLNDTSPAFPVSTDQDSLSVALHHLNQTPSLRTIILGDRDRPISISPVIFWLDDASPPNWPNLQVFSVHLSMVVPDGHWYTIRPPKRPRLRSSNESSDEDESSNEESEDDEEDSVIRGEHARSLCDDPLRLLDDSLPPDGAFLPIYDDYSETEEDILVGNLPIRRTRTKINSERFDPLLLAMAKAAKCMPKIRFLAVGGILSRKLETSSISVTYAADANRLSWRLGRENQFELNEAIINAWNDSRNVSRENAMIGI